MLGGAIGHATTIIPASPGYRLLSLDTLGELIARPVVAWSIVAGGYGGVMPIALGFAAFRNDGAAIQAPDGAVLTLEDDPRQYADAEAWRKAVTAELAGEIWDRAGNFTSGEA
jgi:hypothetical protein